MVDSASDFRSRSETTTSRAQELPVRLVAQPRCAFSRLRNWLRLVIQFRGMFGEEAFSRQGTAPVEGDTARSLLILAGFQASF